MFNTMILKTVQDGTELITDGLLDDKKGRSLLSEALKTKDILC